MQFWKIFLHVIFLWNLSVALRLPKNVDLKVDVLAAIKNYCNGKHTDFCSKKHLILMFRIERQRLEALAAKRQKQKMKNEIIKDFSQIIVRTN